jgi:hypothetical protein
MPSAAVHRPPGLRAGFHAAIPAGPDPAGRDSGLVHAGEQWAPARFRIPPHTHPAPVLAGHPAVAAARRLLERDGARRWTLGDLSREVGLAPGYLAALFVQEVGVSPHRYLTEHRIRQARHLLATGDLP